MKTSAEAIMAGLKTLAPNVAFSTLWEYDPYFRWDGDGPDPVEEGYVAHDVTVKATAIVDGVEIEGVNYLGGCYEKEGQTDLDVHGYLPQMLDEAIDDLKEKMAEPDPEILDQLNLAQDFLAKVSKALYRNQQKRHAKKGAKS